MILKGFDKVGQKFFPYNNQYLGDYNVSINYSNDDFGSRACIQLQKRRSC
jgi:hypothetical protein